MTDEVSPLQEILQQAQQASPTLASAGSAQRDRAIAAMAEAMRATFDEILEANTLDLETSREMAVPELVLCWLKLTPERLESTVEILEHLAQASDPLQAWEATPSLHATGNGRTYGQASPLGTLAFIYEAFADLGAIAAAMCLKTGNSLVLRGGSETSHTNAAFERICQEALSAAQLPATAIDYLADERSDSLQELVSSSNELDLVLVHGRIGLVQKTLQLAAVPVLPLAMGNTCLYWSPDGDPTRVIDAIAESHVRDPDAVNAIEKVLVHTSVSPTAIGQVFSALQEAEFELRGDAALVAQYPDWLQPAAPDEWRCPYAERIVAFRVTDGPDSARTWIQNCVGSHATTMVCQSYEGSRQFAASSPSPLTYINTSPRFHHYYPHNGAIYLGVGRWEGPIDCARLTRRCQVVEGS
ncbi:MAG: aldehyde dehydrogenase family protein [Cyanobacteria bacterium J06641_5]